MPISLLHRADFNARVRNIIELAAPFFKVSPHPIRQALARGYGFNTEAALLAKLDETPVGISASFDYGAFLVRLLELEPKSAEAIGALVEGVRVSVNFGEARPSSREIVHSVNVTVESANPRVIDAAPMIILPDFTISGKGEPYRVDSGHRYRVDGEFFVTRHRSGRGLMTAKIMTGRWGGESFIYAPQYWQNTEPCLTSMKAALARVALPALSARVRCWIWRPDSYADGAWHVEISLGPDILDALGDLPFDFRIPKLPGRLWKVEGKYNPVAKTGAFVEGSWEADLYINAGTEGTNPTPLHMVKAALYDAVYASLQGMGIHFQI